MNDSETIPPQGIIGMDDPMPPIDAYMRRMYVESHLQALKTIKPEWFNYSDTLSERPIDGFIRNLDTQLLDHEIQKDYFQNLPLQQQKIQDQNKSVDPLKDIGNRWKTDPNVIGPGRVM